MNAHARPGATPVRPRRALVPTSRRGGRWGFTLIELIVVVAVVGIIAALLLPNFIQFIHRSRFEGFMRQAQSVMSSAKLEAIRRGTPVVVWVDPDRRELIVFADVHGEDMTDAPEPEDASVQAYDPDLTDPDAATKRRTDYLVGQPLSIPGDFSQTAPTGEAEIDGFTLVNTEGTNVEAAVFRPDGSVINTGAFRFADTRGNFLELRVDPQATARVALRMWNNQLPAWPPGSGEHWYEFGEGGEHWSWK